MLHCKTFEVRDDGTFIPCFGIWCDPRDLSTYTKLGGVVLEPSSIIDDPPVLNDADRYLLRRSGYGVDPPYCVIFGRLDSACESAGYDTFAWRPRYGRTMQLAHMYVTDHWSELESGAVIDVQFILGERTSPKFSERELSGEFADVDYAGLELRVAANMKDHPSLTNVSTGRASSDAPNGIAPGDSVVSQQPASPCQTT